MLLAVKGLNFVCCMSCRVLQTLKLSMAKIMGWGNVGRERRSVVRMMANISAWYDADGGWCGSVWGWGAFVPGRALAGSLGSDREGVQ